MKIVVVGPGAIGLVTYALLSRTKEDVWLLDKDVSRAESLRKNGIRIEGELNIKIPCPQVTAKPQEHSDARFWIICVKSYDTKNVVKHISVSVAPASFVLTLQNGVGNVEYLSESLGAGRVVVGVTHMGATLLEEGVSRFTGEGETVFGRPGGSLSVELKELRELFQKARMPARVSKDITAVLWSKLILNVGINALSALTKLKNGKLMDFEGTRRIAREAITEAVKVAKRKRIKLIYDDILAKAESVCEATADNISSMLADVLSRDRTEIDFLNGAIVRHGESLGVKTPVNGMIVDLVKTIESSYADQVFNIK